MEITKKLYSNGLDRKHIYAWWNRKKRISVEAARLVADDGLVYYLVWPHPSDARIDLAWTTDTKRISFQKIRGVKRLALYSENLQICIKHWIAPKVPGQEAQFFEEISVEDPCANPSEVKFNPGPKLTGTGKPGRTLTAEFGEGTGGVTPYKPYLGRFRFRNSIGHDPWVYITEWSEDSPQTFDVKEEHIGYKLNFVQRIEDQCGQVKETGSSKDIIADTE